MHPGALTDEEAERNLSRISHRWMSAWSIDILRGYVEGYPDQIAAAAEAEAEKIIRAVGILHGVDKANNWEELRRDVIGYLKSENVKTHAAMANAAALVFWHATVDAMAFDLCVLVGKIRPATWDAELAEQRIKSSEVQTEKLSLIKERLLKKYCKDELDKLGLLKKLDLLYRMCGTDKRWTWSTSFTFDEKILERINAQRRQMIHGNGLQSAHLITEDDLNYLKTLGLHLVNLVGYSFGLKVLNMNVPTKASPVPVSSPGP